jgi:chromosome segregation ATPase
LRGIMGAMADELDELYEVKQDEFTALRTKLAAAAKQRGDADTAKQITAARKPTTAAWVVNRLALRDQDVRTRLAGLGERLKDAHAAMDGDSIRALSAEQRRLVDDVARAAFEEAELADPSAALRDDVTGTLQAAIADPDVASRLGRLTKAEQWAGFGEFGDTTMVFTSSRKTASAREKPAEEPQPDEPKRDDKRDAARREHETARAALAVAERANADADAALTELQSDLATARLRRDDARRRLKDAESALTAAQDAYDKGKQAGRDAAAVVKEAKAQLR